MSEEELKIFLWVSLISADSELEEYGIIEAVKQQMITVYDETKDYYEALQVIPDKEFRTKIEKLLCSDHTIQ